MAPPDQRHSCANCSRRKVKCDKLSPCSSCSRSQSVCVYNAQAVSQRHRKRPADNDLLSKVSEYEDLLRKNNVKFQPLDNSWIPSPLEQKLPSRPDSANLGICTPIQTPSAIEEPLQTEASEQQSRSDYSLQAAHSGFAHLWAGLPRELRDSPIQQLKRSGKEQEDEPTGTGSGFGVATCLLFPFHLNKPPQLLEIHPEPKHIVKLWQAFAENVNPLTKVIHAPTLQQRILEVSWNLEAVTRPLEAVMFGVYALAVTSMKPSDCIRAFGETRTILINRYRSGAVQALLAAELHSTRELEVLQAFVLFLLGEPRTELSETVGAIATRIGHKMGLHRKIADPPVSFFDKEMGLRAWWQIIGLESRARRRMLGLSLSMTDYGDVALPMNVNDTELHPHMVHRPVVEHAGATEMLYCLMKYEIEDYVRSTANIPPNVSAKELLSSTSPEGMAKKRTLLADLEKIYEKHLCHCDSSIPLHHISTVVARLSIHRLRFLCYYPRHQPFGGRHMTQADQDGVFDSSVWILQLDHDVRLTNFSIHLLDHLLVRTKINALVYMVSELRHRVSGGMVNTAWALLETMYEEHPQLLQDDDKFYLRLADLVLEAWEKRRPELEAHQGGSPGFIIALQNMRADVGRGDSPMPVIGGMVPDEVFEFGLMHDDPLDWLDWDEFPQSQN